MRVSDHVFEIQRRLRQKQQLIDFFRLEDYQRGPIESDALILIVGGGNRTAKTFSGAMRLVKVLTKTHPTIKREGYQKMRIITEDHDIANSTVIPKLKELIPTKILKGGSFSTAYNKKENRILCPGYGEIQLKTNKQDVEAHRGADLDFIWFDEETKKEIHSENVARLGDRRGLWQMTFTPEKGASFIHEEYMSRCRPGSDMEYYFLSLLDNINIDREAQIVGLANQTDRVVKIKLFGAIINLVGLVYPEFDRKMHVVKPEKPRDGWNLFIGVDFGISNPACAVFWALTPDGRFFQLDEIYGPDGTSKQLGEKVVKLKEERYSNMYFRFGVYDGRSGGQRTYQSTITTAEDFKKGCGFGPFYPSAMDGSAIQSRINAMHNLLVPVDGEPKLKFMSNNRHTLREIGLYGYGKEKEDRNNTEKPLDANDHSMNACEYIAETNPKFFNPTTVYNKRKTSRYSRGGVI